MIDKPIHWNAIGTCSKCGSSCGWNESSEQPGVCRACRGLEPRTEPLLVIGYKRNPDKESFNPCDGWTRSEKCRKQFVLGAASPFVFLGNLYHVLNGTINLIVAAGFFIVALWSWVYLTMSNEPSK